MGTGTSRRPRRYGKTGSPRSITRQAPKIMFVSLLFDFFYFFVLYSINTEMCTDNVWSAEWLVLPTFGRHSTDTRVKELGHDFD